MDARCKQLCACIGFSIRLARKGRKQDVLPHLWRALHGMTAPSTRRPISLYTALGYVSEPTYESPESCNQGVQTDYEVILRPDFERIMENAMAGVRRQTEVMETFQLRIAELELALENKLTASTCPETRCEDSSVAAAANRVSLCGPVSSSSSSGAVEQPSIVKPPPPVFPASIQDQMEAHKRQRQAFKIQRRSHREQVLSARESEREKRLSEEGG